MIPFTFWDKPDLGPISRFLNEWRSAFPELLVHDDTYVQDLIAQHFPEYLGIYRRIRIPTCKSDVALLLALYSHGGLYVDCHCGIRDAGAIKALMNEAVNWEVVLYDKDRVSEPRPAHVLRPLNSVMIAGKSSPLIYQCVSLAFKNLARHFELESSSSGHIPYDIWTMTGPGVLEHVICIPHPVQWEPPIALRPENVGKVLFVPEGPSAPIERYRDHSYNAPGTHWSKRQLVERLFNV